MSERPFGEHMDETGHPGEGTVDSRPIYGVMAEFSDPDELLGAAQAAYEAGYRKMDAFSPFPIHGLSEAIGFHHTRLPIIIFIGGLLGGVGGFYLQYWISVINYPLNIGGRPYNSWPAFIPATFELTILCAAFAAVFGMLALNGLPMPYHPVFNVRRFSLATRSSFFLCIESTDPQFDLAGTRQFLETLNPREVSDVER
jgi:hypothetical protein